MDGWLFAVTLVIYVHQMFKWRQNNALSAVQITRLALQYQLTK